MDLWIASLSLFLMASAQTLPNPPRIPETYPSVNQQVMISGDLLLDPAIQEAIDYVTAVVPAEILQIAPSVYRPDMPNSPVYPDGQAEATCYWPLRQCLRTEDSESFTADVFQCPRQNDWGLTYDDGPTVHENYGTTQLLEKLDQVDVKATFFVVGSNAVQFPNILKAIDAAGHELALHTWTHHPLTSLTNEQIVAELKFNEAIVYSATGKVAKYMRPPYGNIDDRVRAICAALGFEVIMWSDESGDTFQPVQAAVTIREWFAAERPGFISLQHDILPSTTRVAIQALDAFAVSSRPTLPQPVSQCRGIPEEQWYKAALPVNTDGSIDVSGTNTIPGSNTSGASTSTLGGITTTTTSSSLFILFIYLFLA